MNEQKLTAEQVLELQPYERHFTQATRAAWCSYPGQAGIAKMLDIWESLTGGKYPYQPGCSNCLLNLVRDLGTIYFAQKGGVLAAEMAEKAAEIIAVTKLQRKSVRARFPRKMLLSVLPTKKWQSTSLLTFWVPKPRLQLMLPKH